LPLCPSSTPLPTLTTFQASTDNSSSRISRLPHEVERYAKSRTRLRAGFAGIGWWGGWTGGLPVESAKRSRGDWFGKRGRISLPRNRRRTG
jgi:hypothetical protein